MRKKLAALLLAGVMGMSLAACADNSSTTETAGSGGAGDTGAEATGTGAGSGTALDTVWPAGTTVYIDVPAKAGGGTDLYTRYLTQALGEVVPGVNFVVTNYDTTEVGREHLKNADPNGQYLLIHHAGMFLEYISGGSNVSAKDDYATVGIVNLGGPQAIIAKPDAPYHSFAELGEYIAANPGEVVIGCTLGGASQASLYNVINSLGENYAESVNWVQCGSEADKLTQTASGSIDIANASIPNALSYEADGRLTILGSLGPSIATLANMSELLGTDLGEQYATGPEQGYEDAVFDCSYYVWAPKDTPDEICEAINEVIQKATKVESFVEGNKAMATFVDAVNLQESRARQEEEWEIMDKTAEQMGVKVR